jgi:hypothetical protein
MDVPSVHVELGHLEDDLERASAILLPFSFRFIEVIRFIIHRALPRALLCP